MNGTISVESEPGKGSVFTVRIPQGTVDGSGVLERELAENLKQFRLGKAAQTKKAAQITREYMPYGKVLVVDDVETNLYVANGLLAPYGLMVETVKSGFEAVEKIKDGAVYDIIFMDHFMPKMDGMVTTKKIRELGYTQPIIALTANALAGQAEIFLANGFNGFISKPIDIRQLNTTLNKMIRDKQPFEVIDAARRQKAARQDPEKSPPPDAPLTDEDQAILQERLKIVQTACEARDKQTAKTVLVELKHKAWSRLTKDLLNTIIEQVMKDNFEEAANLSREYTSGQKTAETTPLPTT
jgi:CheY-like chemotaxis protein